MTLGAPAFPLFVLFGLNAVDELDRSAFAVLLPDIRDHFELSNAGALRLVSLTTIAVLLIEVPLSFYCDRGNRVRIATVGAALWGFFSIGTGAAVSVGMLVAMRIGAGGGRAVVTPTHSSLLSDFYEPAARVKVFSVHRQANSVGQILGPLVAGVLALHFGFRVPFFVFAVPTLVFVLLALRLREPVRGYYERRAAGADEATALVADEPERAWATMQVLSRVRTIRRIWLAVPFLAVALFGVPNLLALVYEEVFGLDSAARGAIAAGVEPLQVLGVFVAMPRVAKVAMTDPGLPAALRRHRRRGRRGAPGRPRLRPQRGRRRRDARAPGRVHRHARPCLLRPRLDRRAGPGPGGLVLHDLRVRHPGDRGLPARDRPGVRHAWASRPAWSCWCPSLCWPA